jgi:hypothetical protein
MLFAKVSGMQPQLPYRVVMPEHQPMPALVKLTSKLAFTTIFGIIGHMQSPFMSKTITVKLGWQCINAVGPQF